MAPPPIDCERSVVSGVRSIEALHNSYQTVIFDAIFEKVSFCRTKELPGDFRGIRVQ